ncbi:hypothetical protein RHSIM_Rhsim13G0158700 [Rhododendron simsii]|uniref:Serine-threonine/tyrosine-protein kinase catalytic domain-containing protein n=1 Tax=Rhododendron simsii TaxID=118357 RepID=A0A834FYH3_RHOSS|nr:hypothetical protein RHSIM_Rhsim13G0158700 [Rhododendron simsii]
MLRPVTPSLNFWYYLGIISSPSWVFSFLAIVFGKKRTSLVAVLLISTLVISGSNYVLSKLYFWLRRNPIAGRFFGGYKRAGKSIVYVLLFFGNIGLYCYSEKSLASVLTFLFLAFYCLSHSLLHPAVHGFWRSGVPFERKYESGVQPSRDSFLLVVARYNCVHCYRSGYMSPEYIMHGKFSTKSDVFSFGVLAWKLWREGTPLDLLDPTLEGSYARNEVTR